MSKKPFGAFFKNRLNVLRLVSAFLLCVLSALLIIAFGAGKLPYAEDGDAFDTVYVFSEPSVFRY